LAFIDLNNVIIKGIASCVPSDMVDNLKFSHMFSETESRKFLKTTGIRFRRIARKDQTTSDLGFAAAENLITEMKLDKSEIDGVVFISQTPDYNLPATAIILQHRLKLPKTTLAFDVSLGCSGYVYGLSIAGSLLNSGHIRNILVICGDTSSKSISEQDKSAILLFGDAATATIVGVGKGNMSFSLNSDGGGANILQIKSGMFRNLIKPESLIPYQWEDGNIRADNQLFMDGMEIFNFSISEVPRDIKILLRHAGVTFDNIDHVIYHQANKFILDFISKKLKLPSEKIPFSLPEYGNTSSASIPLTICHSLSKRERDIKLLLSGFGVGLSWAHCLLNLGKETVVCEIIEV